MLTVMPTVKNVSIASILVAGILRNANQQQRIFISDVCSVIASAKQQKQVALKNAKVLSFMVASRRANSITGAQQHSGLLCVAEDRWAHGSRGIAACAPLL